VKNERVWKRCVISV